ncbi:MAG: hypothetical protein ABSC22_11750 [Roseiarcus sp.]|jgi:hypothetical protein
MLRVLAICWLVAGLACAANAQALSLRQDAAENYAYIGPGNISSDVRLWQTGKDNVETTVQNSQDNSIYVNQRATNSNTSTITQYGAVNTAIVVQQYNFKTTVGNQSGYVGQQTNNGYLSEFNSGGASILTLTGSSNTLISSFGRGH